jgi:hypothetical protein
MIKDEIFTTFILKPKIVKGKPIVKEPDEIERWDWFDPNKLPDPMYPPSKKAIEQYFRRLGF